MSTDARSNPKPLWSAYPPIGLLNMASNVSGERSNAFYLGSPNPHLIDWRAAGDKAVHDYHLWFVRQKDEQCRWLTETVGVGWNGDFSRKSLRDLSRWLASRAGTERFVKKHWAGRIRISDAAWTERDKDEEVLHQQALDDLGVEADDLPDWMRGTRKVVYERSLSERSLFDCALTSVYLGECVISMADRAGLRAAWKTCKKKKDLLYGNVLLHVATSDWKGEEDPFGAVLVQVRDHLRRGKRIDLWNFIPDEVK